MEQVTGIGPAYLPWQGNVLPLNYTCMSSLGRLENYIKAHKAMQGAILPRERFFDRFLWMWLAKEAS